MSTMTEELAGEYEGQKEWKKDTPPYLMRQPKIFREGGLKRMFPASRLHYKFDESTTTP